MFRKQKITFAFFAGSINLLGTLGTHDGSISDGGFDTIKKKNKESNKATVCVFTCVFSVLHIFLPFIAKRQGQIDPIMDNMKTQQLTFGCSDVVLIILILLILLTIITHN